MNALSISIAVMDFLSVSALISTGELKDWAVLVFFLGAIGAIAFHRWAKPSRQMGESGILALLIFAVVAGVSAWKLFKIPTLVAASHSLAVFFTILWYLPQNRYRGWRIAIGFTTLVIASVMTPEAFLALFIIAFVLTSSIALSLLYLETELAKRNAGALGTGDLLLPKRFVPSTLGTSGLILLTALIIFPVLPRLKAETRGELSRAGYTEEVSLQDWTRFSGAGGGTPLVWLYTEDPEISLADEIGLGLVRGRVLDLFDGTQWLPTMMRSPAPRELPAKGERSIKVEAVRNPMGTNVVPVPYGTSTVHLPLEEGHMMFERSHLGEWLDRTTKDRKVKYRFEFTPFGFNHFDPPKSAHLSLPASLKTERLQRVAKKISSIAPTQREKAQRLLAWLKEQNIQPSTDPSTHVPDQDPMADKLKIHPIEQFLFIRKTGHCEWFASSFAVLMRLMGVPSRLVAGFRVGSKSKGNTLTLRSGDAHAWVEIWTDDRGWIPFDPTPKVQRPQGFMDSIRDTYQWISGYWYRYVLTYDEHKEAQLEIQRQILKRRGTPLQKLEVYFQQFKTPILSVVLLMLLGVWRSIRKRIQRKHDIHYVRIHPGLLKARKQVEKWEETLTPEQRELYRAFMNEWWDEYHRLRFGGSHPDDEAVKGLTTNLKLKISQSIPIRN